ncbi:phosphodiester glycosidase family protein [Streptomyces sp. NPDC048290]|uniref:phosphodiester glycosidase family protein n=1 Tax=Streptomyces sp. NPDC048290 TaxID=3155811 RepID=UPI00341920A0
MTRRRRSTVCGRAVFAVVTAFGALVGTVVVGAAPASARPSTVTAVAPGVTYESRDLQVAKGPTRVHLLSVDLRAPGVRLGLLYPGKVASRAAVSVMADGQGAVAGVNGDFFNISETQHPGVEATGASVGPAIADGKVLKSAVPDGQRFGPALPPGTGTEDVLTVGWDRRARLERLTLKGWAGGGRDRMALGGLNQYALPVGSIGAFTADWGSASRVRATCGTDSDRGAPCTTDTYEVTVRGGRVVSTAERPGGGAIAAGSTVLVGREAGARRLRAYEVGERLRVGHRLVATGRRQPYRLAVGGYPVLRDGRPLPGLDDRTAAVRTGAGIADGGRRLLLFAVDGSPGYAGLTIAEVAGLLRQWGAVQGFSLDGGGSSTLVARDAGSASVTVRNHPSGGAERAVPNGIGVFSATASASAG